MSKKKKDTGLTPSAHIDPGSPETAIETVDRFGTYEIQPTADTVNAFPEIRQGFPKKNLDKYTLFEEKRPAQKRHRDDLPQ